MTKSFQERKRVYINLGLMTLQDTLAHFNIQSQNSSTYISGIEPVGNQSGISVFSPVDGSTIGGIGVTSNSEYEEVIKSNMEAFKAWSKTPAPKRGEIVRQIGDALRKEKEALATLLTYEMGKIYQEALGEVQEMIDICDFAVGLSRQLYGLTMHSERPEHRMYEQYHPLGVVGIISAFNFPVAVWAWNAMLALVCGNTCVWKPSEKTPMVALATFKIVNEVLERNDLPNGIISLINGEREVGEYLSHDKNIALLSATGSTKMGRAVGEKVASRFGKVLLELGGNNAVIVTPNANLELAKRAIVFGAVGTAGQRCTSTRRLIIHEDIYEEVKDFLVQAYKRLKIGNPFHELTHVGPVIDQLSIDAYKNTLSQFDSNKILVGNEVVESEKGFYVVPTIVEAENTHEMVQHETFAPILYLIKYSGEVDNAIALQNDVPQGLSSAIFSDHIREVEAFLCAQGSDCGIANVNIGTSGAEIGGAFGGEKETGGGRESGSDAWKVYMRRQTNTINYSKDLPLAQGIEFNF